MQSAEERKISFEKEDFTQRSGYKQASLILKFVRHGLLNDEVEKWSVFKMGACVINLIEK